MATDEELSAQLRIRVGSRDVHYGGGLVAGAFCMQLMGDVMTEIVIRSDGDEGLLRAYENAEFLHPVRAGDYLEARGALVGRGHTSRRVSLEVWKVIEGSGGATASVLDSPLLVARAMATTVVASVSDQSGAELPD